MQDTKSREILLQDIQNVNANSFMNVAMEVFWYQYKHNELYRTYVDNLRGHLNIKEIDFPVFLPIESFKRYTIKSDDWVTQEVFTSSGTTNSIVSKHHVRDSNYYLTSCRKGWEQFFGPVEDYCYLCLLPGYMEREGSSLIKMMTHFVQRSNYQSGFYLNNHKELLSKLKYCRENSIPTVLFGVSFGLLDFIENFNIDFPELIIMETGGMKGRREELLKEELHTIIATKFNVPFIYSEYGMTELFSQAYSVGNGLFRCSNTLGIYPMEISDPLTEEKMGKTGLINLIDLNNLDTCSFIQTQDLGIKYEDGSFKLMGRLDHADIRGCNLMVI